MAVMRPYERDPEAIYARSFATVRREARLDRFDPAMEAVATRVIHACGMVDVADRIEHSPGAGEAGRNAIASGAPIICDCGMVAAGIIRRRLSAETEIVVTLDAPDVARCAAASGETPVQFNLELQPLHSCYATSAGFAGTLIPRRRLIRAGR